MAKNSFRFKQFIIHQDQTAMKVGTDSVLLGAWAEADNVHKVLDAGTGTGILALMIAQRNRQSVISAIDINSSACLQAIENVALSAWKNRITVHNISLQQFAHSAHEKYDLIITNPPYFSYSQKSASEARTCARHSDSLPVDDLLTCSLKLLNRSGSLAVIFPASQYATFGTNAISKGFFEARRLTVIPVPDKPPVRILSQWQLTQSKTETEELIIEKYGRHLYSSEYIRLTKDFYLGM